MNHVPLGWAEIPEPVALRWLRWLDVKDVVATGAVCHSWRRLSQDQLLWRWLLVRDFQFPKSPPPHPPGELKSSRFICELCFYLFM